MRKYIMLGCLAGASFFVGCNQNTAVKETSAKKDQPKELEMYVESELAILMREMYEDNLVLKTQIEKGEIPESFPEDFYNIHTAIATKGMISDSTTYNALAKQYLVNMKKITEATNRKQAKIAYNEMVMTCASCHQIYCQGPLPKIRKMKITIDE